MAIYGDGGASKRAADNAAAEANRQAAAERQRLADEAAAAKVEADRRAEEEKTRQQTQFDAQQAEAERQRQAIIDANNATLTQQQKIEDARKAERDADLARQDKLRTDDLAAAQKQRNDDLARQDAQQKAAQDKATQNAATLTGYSNDRQKLIDNARTSVSSAFDPYNEDFYSKYANDYTQFYKPQVAQQYDDAKRATTFNFANRGNLDSTAAARAFGRLDQTRTAAEADIAQKAQSAASGFRSTVDSQRASLLSGIFGAASAAPPITVDNIGGANDSLRALSTSLTAPVSLAGSVASAVTPPAYGTMTNPFNVPGSAAVRPVVAGGGANGAYTTSNGSSGRLVN